MTGFLENSYLLTKVSLGIVSRSFLWISSGWSGRCVCRALL